MKEHQAVNMRRIGWNGLSIIILLAAAYGLKAHYSQARGEALSWMLHPTAEMVEMVTGIEFQDEGEEGYLNWEEGIRIVPACAGVNFLIVAFLSAGISGLFRITSPWAKGGWIIFAGASAYVMTLIANTARITLSIYAYRADIYAGWITPERIHRMAGVAIYLFFLYLFYLIISKVAVKLSSIDRKGKWPPFAFSTGGVLNTVCKNEFMVIPAIYLSVVLGIPIIKGAFLKNPSLFLEHGLTIIVISLVFYGLVSSLRRACIDRKRNIP